MSQTIASDESGRLAPDPTQTRILNAAHSRVMAVGIRRTTLTDVAARAGLSRMTVYRRFPDVTSVLQALMAREFSWILEQSIDEASDAPHERARIVRASVRTVELLCAHPLWRRLLDVDPELVLPYFTLRAGGFQRGLVAELTERLQAGMAEGSVREGDAGRLARSMELAARGHALAAQADPTRRERREAIEDLGLMLDGLLAPWAA